MNYSTVCSGIEALSVAVEGMGWNAKWFSEIEPFPCRVLKTHYPNVPNLGNMLKLHENETFQKESIDLLCGGTPCQSFSIAGLRGGLADQRGNLALEFCRILLTKQPRWFWWENVPGVLSSNGGEDFQTIVNAFSECGYSCAWRILDAKYFGVPQRRRRIFVVGYLGNDWRPPVSVLFERESLFRNFKQGKKEGETIAGALAASSGRNSFNTAEAAAGNHLIPYRFPAILQPIPINTQSVQGRPSDNNRMGIGIGKPGDPLPTLSANHSHAVFTPGLKVRRITPMEAERLQGFPDQYTGIKGAANSPRYKSLGNSMAVPVMRWIAKRIEVVDKIFP